MTIDRILPLVAIAITCTPPVYLIAKAITLLLSSKYLSKAIVVCPYWPSSTFLLLLMKLDVIFQDFIKDLLLIDDGSRYVN